MLQNSCQINIPIGKGIITFAAPNGEWRMSTKQQRLLSVSQVACWCFSKKTLNNKWCEISWNSVLIVNVRVSDRVSGWAVWVVWVSCLQFANGVRRRALPFASRLPASWRRLRLLLPGTSSWVFFLRHLSIKAVAVVVSYAWVLGCLAVWACLPATTSVCFSAPCAQLGKRKPGSSS